MTPECLNFIRKTWSLAALNQAQAARIFYANLFRIAPETEVLFKNDLTSQGEKLMDTLTFVVDHLDTPSGRLRSVRAPCGLWGHRRTLCLFQTRVVKDFCRSFGP